MISPPLLSPPSNVLSCPCPTAEVSAAEAFWLRTLRVFLLPPQEDLAQAKSCFHCVEPCGERWQFGEVILGRGGGACVSGRRKQSHPRAVRTRRGGKQSRAASEHPGASHCVREDARGAHALRRTKHPAAASSAGESAKTGGGILSTQPEVQPSRAMPAGWQSEGAKAAPCPAVPAASLPA